MRALLFLALLLSACAAPSRRISSDDRLPWSRRGGIEVANVGGELLVVRGAPGLLELVNSPESAGSVASVAERARYAVLINAAMFATDYKTSIGYMRNFDRVNNAHVSARLKGWLLFHPKKAGLPLVKIGTAEEAVSYDSAFQTHRVWNPRDGFLWKSGSVFEQVGLVGVDEKGRVLFFYYPGLLDLRDYVNKILALDLGLTGLLYLDGGHHGALYVARELGQAWNTSIELPNLLGLRAE